jgi:hypothetical protein
MAISALPAVDPGEGGLTNLLALDPTDAFHEFWITIQENGRTPEHTVCRSIWTDSRLQQFFNATAGVGTDGPATNYLALGMGSSAQRGAFDLDFLGYRPGVILPSGFNEPLSFTSVPTDTFVAAGQTASFSAGVRGTPPYRVQWYRDSAPLANATNAAYVTRAGGCRR